MRKDHKTTDLRSSGQSYLLLLVNADNYDLLKLLVSPKNIVKLRNITNILCKVINIGKVRDLESRTTTRDLRVHSLLSNTKNSFKYLPKTLKNLKY